MENGKRQETFSVIRFPFSVMKRSWFPILVVAALLGLLGLLATLQYQWLGQISTGERERLQRLVQSDTQRFAEDFNREIRSAYFNFQMPAGVWRERNWSAFNKPLAFWRERTAYPNLIQDFYFAETGNEAKLLRYNKENGAFEAAEWSEQLSNLKPKLADEKAFEPVSAETFALLMPVHDAAETIDRIYIRTEKPLAGEPAPPVEPPAKYGVLIIKLDENVIKNQILPDLVKKYFSESESANYRLAVKDAQNQIIFQTGEVGSPDARAGLFDLSSEDFMFFANRGLTFKIGERRSDATFVKKFDVKTTSQQMVLKREQRNENGESRVEVESLSTEQAQPRVRVFEKRAAEIAGNWTLSVQHSAGSLEQFITRTRQKNLAISFGILSLLAVSVVFVFLSAQRAKRLAERQLDFVSSVSHEFRTPLAVIYSAGENLADGVAREAPQVSRYGNLIKGEGKKLTAMVEQILDFAGANSGRKKYDLRETDLSEIIENALAECQPLIDEKGITVEREIAANLPAIVADKNALSRAIQNLIGNAVKYSNGEKWLKISATNGGKRLKVSVEDKGIGISAKDLAHVLEPFYRSKTVVDEQIHGNGLGLSLVKQIVEAHKGEIKIESQIGKGSKFTIELLAVSD
jgi:signal transduction histidine kinase